MTQHDLHDLLGDEPARAQRVVVLRQWPLLTFVAGALALLVLVAAGVVLSRAGIALASVHHGCDGSFAGGLVLLVLAGALAGATRVVADLRFPHALAFDGVRAAVLLPVPAFALALTAPGFLGCAWAAHIGAWGTVGEGLLGTPGIAVGAAAAFGLGFAATTAVRLVVPVSTIVEEYERLQATRPGATPPV